MAYEETPDEKQKRQALESKWKAEGDAKAKAADDALVNKVKGMFGMDTSAPAPTQQPVQKKKGGKIRGHGIEAKGKTKGRFC
jgi:hypothetical protein